MGNVMLISGLLQSLIIVFLNTVFFYILSCSLKNVRMLDICWVTGIVFTTYFTLFEFDRYHMRPIVTVFLISVWSIISINRILTLNRLRSPSQAYSTLKAAWKNTFYINFFIRIFCVQAILQYLISLPIIITNTSADQSFGNLDFIALFVYIIGLALIVRGNDDLYLATRVFNLTDTHITKEAFINNKIYYGESCIWISIFIFALSVPYGWISIISPLVIILLLSRLPELYKPLRLIKSDLLGEQI